MKLIKDKTGRFYERPYYEAGEIDAECETIINGFLIQKYGKIEFPIKTEDLTILIENCVEDLDMGADLSEEEGDVEGLTEFIRGRKPSVKISGLLIDNSPMENRLRTTLTHEFFHVRFHDYLYQVDSKPLSLFAASDSVTTPSSQSHKCKRETIIGASEFDWMEWQAGYGCGSFLMPNTGLNSVVMQFRKERKMDYKAIHINSVEGQELIELIAKRFQTSKDAARVRLLQKQILHKEDGYKSVNLF